MQELVRCQASTLSLHGVFRRQRRVQICERQAACSQPDGHSHIVYLRILPDWQTYSDVSGELYQSINSVTTYLASSLEIWQF